MPYCNHEFSRFPPLPESKDLTKDRLNIGSKSLKNLVICTYRHIITALQKKNFEVHK